MKRADILNDFPFIFTREAIQIQGTRCSFSKRHGIHLSGMWICECSCVGVSASNFELLRLNSNSNLPSEALAALLLHWPLTIFRAIQLATLESLLPEFSNELRIHYLGPERELLQLAVFGELQALFPGVNVYIDLFAPAIPQVRDGEKIDLYTYSQCNNMDCGCRSSAVSYRERIDTCHSSAITLRLHAGFYHHCCRELQQDCFPHIIIAANAGVAAYISWLPTI
ncbi:uncharacterized protein LOC131010740 [Salvia miltiorrhiza]|uniref:uncharacterized protein LOC131010740 n=1 Tax=Salvia miltiorrhiza TaxID=226208 RepID=UPI0025AD3E14|nr:uncharacterized protein LOC131010740 [Salvia miltiorrhiza]